MPTIMTMKTMRRDRFTIGQIASMLDKGLCIILYDDKENLEKMEFSTKRNIVEACICNMPLPDIGCIQNYDGTFVLRSNTNIVYALVSYLRGQFALKDLRLLDAEGCKFDDLIPLYQNRIEDKELTFHYIVKGQNGDDAEKMFFDAIEGDF